MKGYKWFSDFEKTRLELIVLRGVKRLCGGLGVGEKGGGGRKSMENNQKVSRGFI